MTSKFINKFIQADPIELLDKLSDIEVDLVVISPNLLHTDNKTIVANYFDEMRILLQRFYDKVSNGGRICLILTHETYPLRNKFLELIDLCDYNHISTITWENYREPISYNKNKYNKIGIIELKETPTQNVALIFSKGLEPRLKNGFERVGQELVMTMIDQEVEEFTESYWEFPSFSDKVNEYPIEMAYRLIQMNSYLGDLVIDPYVTNGNLGIAALETGRRFIGIASLMDHVTKAEHDIISWQHMQTDNLQILDTSNYNLTEFSVGNASCMFCSVLTRIILIQQITKRKIAICSSHLLEILSEAIVNCN